MVVEEGEKGSRRWHGSLDDSAAQWDRRPGQGRTQIAAAGA